MDPYLKERALESPTFGRVMAEKRWNAVCPLRVVVLTSARTYSAGFDAVLALRTHGAKVVGVPSAQAANCFIDTVSFRLIHSRLEGQISFKWSVALPEDPNGQVLPTDPELTYERFKALRFDPNAALILALESDPEGRLALLRIRTDRGEVMAGE